jgi:hypothetical protein
MNPDRIPGDIWDEYGSLQKRAERIITVAHNAWAIEDQLNTFLASLINNSLPKEAERRRKQSTNLAINRQRKHLYRFRLLESYAATQSEASVDKTSFDQVLQAEQLSTVRFVTTPDEWRVLWRLAREEDYKTIAEEEGVSIPALKTRVSRCRCRLRGHLAA